MYLLIYMLEGFLSRNNTERAAAGPPTAKGGYIQLPELTYSGSTALIIFSSNDQVQLKKPEPFVDSLFIFPSAGVRPPGYDTLNKISKISKNPSVILLAWFYFSHVQHKVRS